MPWVIRQPKSKDFCGCPPCALCYVYRRDDGTTVPGLKQMALDLLRREATAKEEGDLKKIAEKIHANGLDGLSPKAPPDSSGAVFETKELDIGMTSLDRVNRWMAIQPKRTALRKVPQPSVDEIFARKAEAAAEKKRVAAALKAEKQRIKELAKLMGGRS